MLRNNLFYAAKPFLPRQFQLFLRRQIIVRKLKKYKHVWPIDPAAGKPPEGWPGWPDGKKFALVLSHDVDTQRGFDLCYKLMELEENLGFRSSFNFVPERYGPISNTLVDVLKKRGFEVCVHGLKHDGKLFKSAKIFNDRSGRINEYLRQWKSDGFTCPSMHRNPEWMATLNIKHSTCAFDTDPFEPQPDGVGTIFPFFVQAPWAGGNSFVELPYTLPQDFTLFILMREKTIRIWQDKLDWVAEKGGMVLVNTHPDYMNFGDQKIGREQYPVEYYREFLEYIKLRYDGQYIHELPCRLSDIWLQIYPAAAEPASKIQPAQGPLQASSPWLHKQHGKD